jgi:hypothetical protein
MSSATSNGDVVPDKAERAHAHGLQIGVSSSRSVQRAAHSDRMPHLLVISNVVPKICARTNSAILTTCADEAGDARAGVVGGDGGANSEGLPSCYSAVWFGAAGADCRLGRERQSVNRPVIVYVGEVVCCCESGRGMRWGRQNGIDRAIAPPRRDAMEMASQAFTESVTTDCQTQILNADRPKDRSARMEGGGSMWAIFRQETTRRQKGRVLV